MARALWSLRQPRFIQARLEESEIFFDSLPRFSGEFENRLNRAHSPPVRTQRVFYITPAECWCKSQEGRPWSERNQPPLQQQKIKGEQNKEESVHA
jgi:hypothetical protein